MAGNQTKSKIIKNPYLKSVEFVLWGEPKAQQRPRTFYKRGAKYPTTWSPKENLAAYLIQIQEQLLNAQNRGIKLNGPIELNATFFMKRPKGHLTKTGKRSKQWKTYPTTKPDYDNLIKGIQDALNTHVIGDDGAIVNAFIFKRYADKSDPCTVLKLDEIHDGDEIQVTFL